MIDFVIWYFMKKKKSSKSEAYEFFIRYQRPEEFSGDPLEFYNTKRVNEYAQSKALMRIQEKITKRALEIVDINPPARVLDLGLGCGFASTYLHLNHFQVVGIDLNWKFLNYYQIRILNPIQADMRNSGFRPNSFDFIISISAVQWILAEKNEHIRKKHLKNLAEICNTALNSNGKIIIQFYPKSDDSMHELGTAFNQTGKFTGNFVIDNPGLPKKRKIFLYLQKKN